MLVAKKQYSAFFFIPFGLWVLYRQIFSSRYASLIQDADTYFALFNYSLFFLFISSLLLIYKVNKEIWLDLLIIATFSISTLVTKQNGFLINFCLVFILCKYIEFKKLLIAFLWLSLISLIVIYLGDLFDIYPDLSIDLFREDGKERHLMGFSFPTLLPNYFFHFVLCYIIIRGTNIRIAELILIVFLNYYLFYMTDTRAVYYLINLLCLLLFLNKFWKINYRSKWGIGFLFRFSTLFSYTICFLAAVYLQCTFSPQIDWMLAIDKALSGRLWLGNHGFNEYGIHLFGANVEYVGFADVTETRGYFYIDSSFQQLLINYGIIPSLLLFIGFTKLASLIIQKNSVNFGLALIFLMLHSLTDPQLINPTYNPIFFALAYLSSEEKRIKLFKDLK